MVISPDTAAPDAVEPFFLDSPQGPLYAIYRPPTAGTVVRGNVLVCMPFNEEMNRCRSMVTLQAQTLARAGWGTLLIDLLGTGDSAGEYRDARWELWLDNLTQAAEWLRVRPGGLGALLGIRLGALLAANLHVRLGDPNLSLVLWQPVADGKTHLTQFMRVRIAANMDRTDAPKETTADMRQRWQAGDSVEIAGYEIAPALAAAMDGLTLAQQQLLPGTRMLWLENASEPGGGLGPASQRLLAGWPGQQVSIDARPFEGPAFWQLFDRVLATEVIAATTQWLAPT